jgi:hypothetical protein
MNFPTYGHMVVLLGLTGPFAAAPPAPLELG